MLTITYEFIVLLVSVFADLHSDADRLSWIQRQGGVFADERAARLVLDEYRRHQHAWHVVFETVIEGKKRLGRWVAQDQTVWASFDIVSGDRTAGIGIVEWCPKGGVAKKYQDPRPLFDVVEIRSRPPLEAIRGMRRRCWLGNWLMVIDIQIPDTSPTGLDHGMDRLLLVTADMQQMLTILPCEGVALPEKSRRKVGDTCHFFMFRFLNGNEVINEQQFFARYCAEPAHDPKVIQFIEQVDQDVLEFEGGEKKWAYEKFQNEEMSPGSYAVAELALRDRAHIALLATKIEEWDMGFETWHHLVIDRVLQKHGPSRETLELLAARGGRGCGQEGWENLIAAFQDPVHRAWLEQGDRLEQLIERSIRPARDDMPRGMDPFRAFYACHLTGIGECWSQGDIGEYHQFIARAEKVLGEDLRYLPEWREQVKRDEPKERPRPFPWKEVEGPWEDRYRQWLNSKLPEDQLIEMR